MTLIELMFACGILAMTLSFLFSSLLGISVIGRLSESRTSASTTISSLLEEIQTMSYDDLLAYEAPDIEGPGVAHTVKVECVLPGDSLAGTEGGESSSEEISTLELPLPETFSGTLPNPLEIRVTLTWREASGHTFRASASTMRGR